MTDVVKKVTSKKLKKSQAYFNPLLLLFYDWVVFKFVSRYIWGVSEKLLIDRYRRLIGETHLEVGVGTGYLLDKLNPQDVKIDLMDLSESCLEKTSRRLSRYLPATHVHNILEPCEYLASNNGWRYQSLSLNFVMHCVPGNFKTKSIAFANLKALLTNDGVLFGSTVVAKGNKPNWLAKPTMRLLNSIGLFNNMNDHPEELRAGLEKHFRYVSVRVVAATAFFVASDDEAVFVKADQDHEFKGC